MSKYDELELFDCLRLHFPDGVDIVRVPMTGATETTIEKVDTSKVFLDGYLDPSQSASIIKHQIYLQEIEPETGIYAAMSPITHRVYVYIANG